MTLFREALCISCGASKRNSDVAHAILQAHNRSEHSSLQGSLDFFSNFFIYEASAEGKIHDLLVKLPNYTCSEFVEGVTRGSVKNGIRCEDLTNLTFSENSFDIVITQDVLEHVSDPWKTFREIARVLKPGGQHIFTVPVHEGRKTITRAKLNGKEIIRFKRAVHHGDPLRKEGSLVFTDFGDDLKMQLDAMGMPTELKIYSRWYSPWEISFVDDNTESYGIYQKAYNNKMLGTFFKYNSAVFISQKTGISFTGERYLPWMEEGDIHYEHLHRYRFAKELVNGKKVLDLACGEGYGSNMLAEVAESVVGIDIDEMSIKHAVLKYVKGNLKFIKGSITEIPVKGEKIFDVIICFEALEHIEEHYELMKEIKRLLKDDGIFIVSTPNKFIYSVQPNYKNPFHLKELYFDEFKNLLLSNFKNVFIYGQKIYPVSNIFAFDKSSSESRDFVVNKSNEEFQFSSQDKKAAKYLIAIATNGNLNSSKLIGNSYLVDISETLFRLKDEQIRQKEEQIIKKDEIIETLLKSSSWKITEPLRWLKRLFRTKFK
ncbi:MAG: methyltransferase domain-containing protein [Elusimicrobiota bacterium]